MISCGSFTASAGTGTVTLGYEPQWVLLKRTDSAQDWYLVDTMRGQPVTTGTGKYLVPNSNAAEATGGFIYPTATGFQLDPNAFGSGNNGTYIYIAIRRGPMKVPTDGTKVFAPVTRTGTGATAVVTTPNFVVDSAWIQQRTSGWQAAKIFDRLRGATNLVYSNTTSAEVSETTTLNSFASNVGFTLGDDSNNYSVNRSGEPYINYAFQRAPSFFDEVCYIGTSTAGHTENHNLGVSPELIITKCRNTTSNWTVVSSSLNSFANYMNLNQQTASLSSPSAYTVTSTTFTMFNGSQNNTSGNTYVAYLFSTCLGVSKVGSYTGNGTTQTINCGFTGGARFVLIKRTDATSDWYVYDTARGMTTLTDPYLLLNSTAAEVATLGSVTTVTTGFALNEAIFTGINTNAATYIFLAIA